ncbi:polysialic acid transport protein KpsD precursor [bacterium BMS3Bbin03]|nr:polysialic acid transport protein KpsD precursor [bacterium BMS3Bbin03]
MINLGKKNLVWLTIPVTLLFLGTAVFAQIPRQQQQGKLTSQQVKSPAQTKEEIAFEEVQLKLMEQAFEKAVNPETYIVGPGDIFSIVIWGDIQKGFQIPVTAEGKLIIPTIGSLQVADKTLADVKKMVLKAGAKKYLKANVSAYLMVIRKIRVHVVGEVTQPGTYVATPLDRMTDLIARAGELTDLALPSAIEITHTNGKTDTVDYDRFREFGELKYNPHVNGGDIIYIPAFNKETPIIIVKGLTNSTGTRPVFAGETLASFLIRNNVLDKSIDMNHIRVIRKKGPDYLFRFPSQQCNQFKLLNNDIIKIERLRNTVYVKGAVQKPGKYRYSPGFTVLDYVGMAGGMEKSGSLGSIKVYHIATGKTEKGVDAIPQPGDVVELPETLRERIISYFQIASQVASVIIAIAAVRTIK